MGAAEELLAAVAAEIGQPMFIPAARVTAVFLAGNLLQDLFTTDRHATTQLSLVPKHKARRWLCPRLVPPRLRAGRMCGCSAAGHRARHGRA